MAYADSIRTTDYTREELANLIDGNRFVGEAVTTAGTAPAYEVTLTPSPAAYFDGMTFTIKPHQDLVGTSATINVNGLGARPIVATTRSTSSRNLLTYELNNRGYHTLSYNSAGDYFVLHTSGSGSINFTPTVTTQAGSVTLVGNGSFYSYVNHNKILVGFELQLAQSGASSDYIVATLPIIRGAGYDEMPLSGWMTSVNGQTDRNLTAALRSSNSVYFYRGDGINDFPIDSEFYLYAMGIYEIG